MLTELALYGGEFSFLMKVLGSISAALLSPVIDSPRQRLIVELKEMHNTGKKGSCGLICIDWLIQLLHNMVDRCLVFGPIQPN